MSARQLSEPELRRLFDDVDRGKHGSITEEEFKLFLEGDSAASELQARPQQLPLASQDKTDSAIPHFMVDGPNPTCRPMALGLYCRLIAARGGDGQSHAGTMCFFIFMPEWG